MLFFVPGESYETHQLATVSGSGDGRIVGADAEHITGDIKRAFTSLITEWILYMKHLKRDYPYLYSLAVRTNPFNPEALVEIKN